MEQLLPAVLSLARRAARRLPATEWDDLASDASLALLEVVRTQREGGVDLRVRALFLARLRMIDGLRTRGMVGPARPVLHPVLRWDSPVRDGTALTLAEVVPAAAAGRTEFELAEWRADLRRLAGTLTDAQRSALTAYFVEEVGLAAIGARRGAGETAASKLIRTGLQRLARAYGVDPARSRLVDAHRAGDGTRGGTRRP